jgi:dipeptidase D
MINTKNINLKNKKKIIIIVVAIILVIAAIGAGLYFYFSKENIVEQLSESVDNRVAAYTTDLKDSIASMTDQKSVANYLTSWASHKGIESKVDKNYNVIFSFPASDGYENQNPAVIVTSYDYYCMESYTNSLVTALTIAKNDNPHREYKIIFLSSEKGSLKGAETIAASYFTDNSEVFYLGNSISSRIAQKSGGYEEYTISKELTSVSPSYNKAYKITLSGLTSKSTGTRSAAEPNPIKTLGNFLATCKSSSILFELASFTGGENSRVTPSEASVTVVVGEAAATKLQKKLDSAIEKFYEKYSEKYPNLSYTYEIVETPSKVLSQPDDESIVSLLYTALSGVYSKNNSGNIEAFTNIGFISTEDGIFTMEVSASSYNSDLLNEIEETFVTISGLADVDFNIGVKYPTYVSTDVDNALEDSFRDSYYIYQSTELETLSLANFTPCQILRNKNAQMPMILLGVTEKTRDNFAGGMIVYLATKKLI